MKIVLCKSEGMGDWYTIERAEHGNTHGMVMDPEAGCMKLMYSGRISDADVEGTAAEMLAIAKAIKERKENSDARRCAVSFDLDNGRAFFWSPRNSMQWGETTLAEADELAEQIREKLGGVT